MNHNRIIDKYYYTKSQPDECNSKVLQEKCEKLHETTEKQGEYYLSLVLYVGKTPCFCPFAKNRDVNIVNSDGLLQTSNKTVATTSKLSTSTTVPADLLPRNQENYNSNVYVEIRKRGYSGERLYHPDNVGKPDCYDVSQSPTFSDIMGIVAKTIKEPVTTLYEHFTDQQSLVLFGTGCPESEEKTKKLKELESAARYLLYLFPETTLSMLTVDITSALIYYFEDIIEGKELPEIEKILFQKKLRKIGKSMMSSVSYKNAKELPIDVKSDTGKKMLRDIVLENDNIYLKLNSQESKTEVIVLWNHFVEKNGKHLALYDVSKGGGI